MALGLFHGLLPRLFVYAFVLRNVAITAAGGELAASRAPKVALITVDWTS